jgi:hypothetical protein
MRFRSQRLVFNLIRRIIFGIRTNILICPTPLILNVSNFLMFSSFRISARKPCMPMSDAVEVHLIHLFAQPVEEVDSLKVGGTRNER